MGWSLPIPLPLIPLPLLRGHEAFRSDFGPRISDFKRHATASLK